MAKLNKIDRRRMLQAIGWGTCGLSISGWLPAFAAEVAANPQRRRHCILLWMAGGPSQTDTFDMKPNHENGGEFKEIATNVPGIRFSEHMPRLAQQADKLAIIRSLSTKEGDHERASYLMRTGERPMSVVQYPTLAAALAKELAAPSDLFPPYVSIAPNRTTSQASGFLGPKFAPLVVSGGRSFDPDDEASYAELAVRGIEPPASVSQDQMTRRLDLWRALESEFLTSHSSASPQAHRAIYDNALSMIRSDAAKAFDLSQEPDAVRQRYGRGQFGQGCLLARRLVEQGVPFVEVSLSGSSTGNFTWDTHSDNFNAVAALSAELDAGWASLMEDLAERGLLESTTVMWMGEFGRTPQINGNSGRDHFPSAWSCVLGGGGIAGGQVYGRTSDDGREVVEDETGVHDVLATLCSALGVPPYTENTSNTGRPIPLVNGSPIRRLLA